MFEYWFWVTVPLLLFVLLGLGIYSLGRYPRKKEDYKEEAYTCGEPLPDIQVPSDSFYQAIKRTLKVRRLHEFHTGNLSDYLFWVLVGLTAIILLVVMI
jgi:hypothetical protein